MKVITRDKKTREELANPFAHLTYEEQVRLSGGEIGEFEIINLGNGYSEIRPVKTKEL